MSEMTLDCVQQVSINRLNDWAAAAANAGDYTLSSQCVEIRDVLIALTATTSTPPTQTELQTWWDSLDEAQRRVAYDHGHVISSDLLSLAVDRP